MFLQQQYILKQFYFPEKDIFQINLNKFNRQHKKNE